MNITFPCRSALRASVFVLVAALCAGADDAIPRAAWRIPIGQPPANPGGTKPELANQNIDDGYWQGAPVGVGRAGRTRARRLDLGVVTGRRPPRPAVTRSRP